MNSFGLKQLLAKLSIVSALLLITACAENVSTVALSDGQANLKLSPPSFILSRAVIAENLLVEVSINNQPVALAKSAEVWTGQATVPVNLGVELEVKWFEQFKGEKLPLAIARKSQSSVTSDISLEVVKADYTISGDGFDWDADSISNIVERRQDTDPLDAASPGVVDEVEPMVKVPASQIPNEIDAEFNAVFWNNGQFLDTTTPNPVTLLIDNLIVEEASNQVVGAPNYQWAAIHDGEFLTLFVFGKRINVAGGVAENRDSGTLWFNDDSIEIFWDGNLSRLNNYDSEDDMHIMIPLVRGEGLTAQANKSGESDTEIKRGANVNSAIEFDVDNVEFAACLCQGERLTWEIRIDLAEANIPIGKTFGFEIQINQDDDGGNRDSKWAWALPARQAGQSNTESDITWRFPSTMGTMKLLPFPGQ